MTKPVIIDYPEDRRRLIEEFNKMAAGPEFAKSIEMAKEVIMGKPKRKIKQFSKKKKI